MCELMSPCDGCGKKTTRTIFCQKCMDDGMPETIKELRKENERLQDNINSLGLQLAKFIEENERIKEKLKLLNKKEPRFCQVSKYCYPDYDFGTENVTLRMENERLRAELSNHNEFICRKCGLRQEGEKEEPNF